MRWYQSTDNIDISAHSIGIHNTRMLPERGLHIQIRHNGDVELFIRANELAELIAAFLNGETKNEK